jgi:hypothetical protein
MPTTTTLINIRQFFREREGRKRKNTLNKSKSTRSRPQQWTEESVISNFKDEKFSCRIRQNLQISGSSSSRERKEEWEKMR